MFANMKLGSKIAGGFTLALVLTSIIGVVSVVQFAAVGQVVNQIVSQEIPETSALVETERATWHTHVLSYEFDIKLDEQSRREWFQARDKALKAVEAIVPIATALKHEETLKAVADFKRDLGKYAGVGGQYTELALANKVIEAEMDKAGEAIAASIEGYIKEKDGAMAKALAERNLEEATVRAGRIKDANDALVTYNEAREHQLLYLLHKNKKDAEMALKETAELMSMARKIESESRSAADKKVWNDVTAAADRFSRQLGAWVAAKDKQVELLKQSDALALAVIGLASKTAIQADKDTYEIGRQAMDLTARVRLIVTVLGLVALAAGVVLAVFITLSITRPIRRVIAGLAEGASQVASASGQVNTASQSLAEGAAQQAAALEETSSSLEEMASMTKQNADNAQQANGLSQETNQTVGRANQAMGELTKAMAEISTAGEQTGKIIKTIDEIAFQTNLLALNAAVEAARAGEAGAGFAVVAEEVRNLAQRAAEAAKNTAGLIEGAIKKVKEGSDLVTHTNEAFAEVARSSQKVGELLGEIAAASAEQAQGIGQVNKAVTEMDKVTQQNAANAEESAAASEELSSQADTMQGHVVELSALVGGSNGQGGRRGQPRRARLAAIPMTSRSLPAPGATVAKAKHAARKEPKPREALPLEEDFRDF